MPLYRTPADLAAAVLAVAADVEMAHTNLAVGMLVYSAISIHYDLVLVERPRQTRIERMGFRMLTV